MTDELVVTNNSIIRTMDDAERAAKAMAASGFFPDSRQAAQAVVKILAGQELGFGPFASMTGVYIIQGKPVLSANLMAAAVKRTGKYNYRVVQLTDQLCELAFFEDGQEVGRSSFSIQDANNAGLNGKDNWRKFPRNMLFARALSNGQRWYAPDVFSGAVVYTPDELGATVNEEGSVIDAQVIEPPASIEQPANNGHEATSLPTMSYETAYEVLNSAGTKYGDLPTDKLSHMYNAIMTRIKNNNLDADELEKLQYKASAIQTIMTHRAGQMSLPASQGGE